MKKILLVLGLLLSPQIALAQAPTKICVESADGRSCVAVSSTAPLPVTAPNGVNINNPLSTGIPGIPATDQVISSQYVNATATGSITTQNLNPSSGTATANSTVAVPTYGVSCTVQVTGTYSGSLSVQWTADDINWITSAYANTLTKSDNLTQTATITSATQNIWAIAAPSNVSQIRVTALGAQTGTAVVTLKCSAGIPPAVLNIAGLAAHGSTVVGSPVLVGGSVVTAAAAALSSGVAVRAPITSGLQVIEKPYAPGETDWQVSLDLASTSQTALKAAGAANIRNYTTACQISGNATAVAGTLTIQDGSTTLAKINIIAAQPTLLLTFPTPLRGTAATAANVVLGTAPVGTVTVNCQGYQGP